MGLTTAIFTVRGLYTQPADVAFAYEQLLQISRGLPLPLHSVMFMGFTNPAM